MYGLENVFILALFGCIQNIAHTFDLVYLNNLPDLYIILLEIYIFLVYNFANTSVNSVIYFMCKTFEKWAW